MSGITAAPVTSSANPRGSDIETPKAAGLGSPVSQGRVAARIRSFQGQDARPKTPSPAPSPRKTPKRLRPESLMFLEQPKSSSSTTRLTQRGSKTAASSTSSPTKRFHHVDAAGSEGEVLLQAAMEPAEPTNDKDSTTIMQDNGEHLLPSEQLAAPGKARPQTFGDALSGWRQPSPTRMETSEAKSSMKSQHSKAPQQKSQSSPVTATSRVHVVGTQHNTTSPLARPRVPSELPQREREDSLSLELQDLWKIAAEGSSGSGGSSSDKTAKELSQHDYAQQMANQRFSWLERSMGLDTHDQHIIEDNTVVPSWPFRIRRPPTFVQAPQPCSPVKAKILGDQDVYIQPCSDEDHLKDRPDTKIDQGSIGPRHAHEKGVSQDQEICDNSDHLEFSRDTAQSIQKNKRTVGSHRTRIGSKVFDDLQDDRFDVFVRERTDMPIIGLQVEDQSEGNTSAMPGNSTSRSLPISKSHSDTKPSRPLWRWWKLVFSEQGSSKSRSSEMNNARLSNVISEQPIDQSDPTKTSGSSPSNDGSLRGDSELNESRSTSTQSGESGCGSFQPAELRAIPDTVKNEPSSKKISGLRVHDAFGHGVLINDQELATETIEALSKLPSNHNTPERTSRVHRQQRQRKKQQDAGTDKIHVPVEAIAPIIQNDGATSHYQSSPLEHPWSRTRPDYPSMITGEHFGFPIDPLRESGSDDGKIAVDNEGKHTIMNVAEEPDEKGNKIIVTVEDGIKKILQVEIYASKGNTVITKG